MERVDQILDGIEAGMTGAVIEDPQTRIRNLEDEVWAELSESYEHPEAVKRFLGWRAIYSPEL